MARIRLTTMQPQEIKELWPKTWTEEPSEPTKATMKLQEQVLQAVIQSKTS